MLTEAQDEIAQLKRALELAKDGGGDTHSEEHQRSDMEMQNKITFLQSMMVGAGGGAPVAARRSSPRHGPARRMR